MLYQPSCDLTIHGTPPALLLPWLLSTGSLTAKFESLSGQPLMVASQFEGRVRLSRQEQQQLEIAVKRPQSAWVREALLYGDTHTLPWVDARSVFPFISLVGDGRQLANLGRTPIGYVIFGRQQAQMTKRIIEPTAKGWRRTSLYSWQGRPLIVAETFLPAFLAKINSV